MKSAPLLWRFLRSILWKVFFVILMLVTLLLLPLLLICRPFITLRIYRLLVWRIASLWGRITVWSTGSLVTFEGRELIPSTGRICFVGNHQSLFDIPAFLACVGRPVGYIAKRELQRFPVLRQWMAQMPCLFLDRQNARQALRLFARGKKLLESGFPLVIFPEGGRSGETTMRPWHPGALRLPLMAKATIVPVVIDGTWKIMGLNSFVNPARVTIRILPPITPQDPIYSDKARLPGILRERIATAISELPGTAPATPRNSPPV